METAGDCYIVAGALMRLDEDGFQALEADADVVEGAEKVMAFAKVRLDEWDRGSGMKSTIVLAASMAPVNP